MDTETPAEVMALPQGDVGLLRTDVARRLLSSRELARMAYVAADGTPRVFPMLFHWTGTEIVLSTFRPARKIAALRARPDVAITIDAASTPPEVLLVRGRVEITDVVGIVPEYALAQHRYAGQEQGAVNVAEVDHRGVRMARIAVRPTWVGVLDFCLAVRPWPNSSSGAGRDGSARRQAHEYRGARPMTTYVLIHEAASDTRYWHHLAAELRTRGHDVVAPDLPCDDDAAGLPEYADTVIDAIGDRGDVVLVAQSFGGFTAALVYDQIPVRLLVLLTAMIPRPGETPGDWWTNTGWQPARSELEERIGVAMEDDTAVFLHDVSPGLAAEAREHARDQSATPFARSWALAAWPATPTRFLLCRDDRFFPAEFMRRVVTERLDIVADEIDGGHSIALSHPVELADRLEAYCATTS